MPQFTPPPLTLLQHASYQWTMNTYLHTSTHTHDEYLLTSTRTHDAKVPLLMSSGVFGSESAVVSLVARVQSSPSPALRFAVLSSRFLCRALLSPDPHRPTQTYTPPSLSHIRVCVAHSLTWACLTPMY